MSFLSASTDTENIKMVYASRKYNSIWILLIFARAADFALFLLIIPFTEIFKSLIAFKRNFS